MTAPQTTPGSRGKVLVIDDEVDIREGLELLLTTEGYLADTAHNGTEGLQKLASHSYDLVLLDLMMPDKSGMEVLEEVRQRDKETPIFMITAYGSVEAAVSALKLGANDYFSKPWDNDKLIIEIDRMIARRQLEWENTHLKRALKQRYSFPNIIGKSERMVRLLDLVGQVASSRSTILITGRNRHRERTRRQGHPRQLAARRPDVRGGEQRIAAARPAGINALRPRARRLHQRDPDQEGILRGRRSRARSSSTRSARSGRRRRSSCCACSRKRNSPRWARPTRRRWTCASWPRPTRTWRNWSRKASSARTCTTG